MIVNLTDLGIDLHDHAKTGPNLQTLPPVCTIMQNRNLPFCLTAEDAT